MILRIVFASLIITATFAVYFLPKTSFKIPILANNQKPINFKIKVEGYLTPVPVQNFQEAPAITARSAIIIDATSGHVLYQKEPDIPHLPASTTKLMTALVVLENCDPQKIVNVNYLEKEGTQMGLATGDQVTVENLLYGLLVASGNDAAYVLASSCSDSYSHFILEMNRRAQSLAMDSTHFVNPAGFDSPFQYSTARDLAKLAKIAIANPLLSKIVTIRSTVVTDVSGRKTYYLENINKLLGFIDGIEGVKTGQTDGSLEILISKVTRHGNSIIVVVLGSQDRFEESRQLIEWTFKNFQWTY